MDALTAESLRADVIDIWSFEGRNPVSILMVSHDIKEVAYMADRIIVLGANPGCVRAAIENHLPRPRDYRSPELLELVDRLHEIITGHELPDKPAAAGESQRLEVLPSASTNEIIGLLEYLDAHGARQNLFHLSAETHREFGRLIRVVTSAEILGLVETPGQVVALTSIGRKFVASAHAERKQIWRELLLKLQLFRSLHQLAAEQPNHSLLADIVIERIAAEMPQEHPKRVFDTLIRWSRYGGLFSYDGTSKQLSLT